MSQQQATSAKKETAKKTAKSSRATKAMEPSLNMNELRELAELVDAHGFTDFEFENETIRVRLSKQIAPPQIIQSVQPAAAAAAAPTAQSVAPAQTAAKPETPHPGAKADAEAAADEDLYKIPSPIVGTFYRSPSPDKDPYVQIGSRVAPEAVVCIIEAMKLMNEIQAEVSGEVVKIYVENGQPVEYGQPLFGIRK
ncbi:MAG TPA: acetyl-CoA carboxylase biotin carboxyl carrier protein [Pyrinomonadaceae bacterium]|jgi:acetyl-CoA carboxylase biotin carboxyl carrier protein